MALATPLADDGTVDRQALDDHLELLLEHDLDGLLLAGTTGEGPLLSDDEIVELTKSAASAAPKSASVIAQVGRLSTSATLRLAERVLEAGADELAVVVPYFYRLDVEEVIRHYQTLINALAPMPLIAYNIPRRTVNDLSAEVVSMLAARGLQGIKDSTVSLERHLQYVAIQDEPQASSFRTYAGSDLMMLDAIRAGSRGIISALSNAAPELHLNLRAAYSRGDESAMTAANQALVELRQTFDDRELLKGTKQLIAERLRNRDRSYPVALRHPLINQ